MSVLAFLPQIPADEMLPDTRGDQQLKGHQEELNIEF